jgi:TRAP-type C4-dicarboxylate transport system substrate-binding protein
MKRKHALTTLGALLAVVVLCAPVQALNLRFNVMFTPKHPLCREAFVPWSEQVKEVTDGRVKVTMFYSNALFKPKDALKAIASRVGDIGIVLPSYNRNKLLMNTVMEQPMVAGEKALVNSEVMWELYQSVPEMQNELKEVKVLWVYMNPAFQLHFSKKNVATLNDLQNTVVSAGGTTQTQIVRALGASPEAMPMVNVFLAMQKGVVEGCFLPYAPLRTQKIANLVKYHTNANLMAVTFFIAVNKGVWDKISPQDQKAIEAISGLTAAQKCGQVFDKAQQRDTAWMQEKGHTFVALSAEQQQMWATKVNPIRQTWIKDAKAKGYAAPEKVLERALQLMSEKSQ